jgi:mutator protein MutT
MSARRSVTQGVVVVVASAGRLLVIRRAEGIRAAGAWCFVGGAIEDGETPEQAVVREFREEVGGIVRPIRKVWEWERPDGRLRLHWWLAELDGTPLVPNPAEVGEYRWLHPADISALPSLLESNRAFLAAFDTRFDELVGGTP